MLSDLDVTSIDIGGISSPCCIEVTIHSESFGIGPSPRVGCRGYKASALDGIALIPDDCTQMASVGIDLQSRLAHPSRKVSPTLVDSLLCIPYSRVLLANALSTGIWSRGLLLRFVNDADSTRFFIS